ncbi:hypothetical protein BJ742DRAFT_798398 [Cladochytrium replicatum]|nr:hypothetical protein BJ742DRAFT_798398 [Cladochytrium replicatum]
MTSSSTATKNLNGVRPHTPDRTYSPHSTAQSSLGVSQALAYPIRSGPGGGSESPIPAAVTPSARYATLSIEASLDDFKTNAQTGLSSVEAIYRHRLHGANELVMQKEESIWEKVLEQFKNPMIMLLLGSAFISLIMGQIDDAVSITLAIIIVVTVAFVQEYRSEQSLEALNQLVPHYCTCVRDSQTQTMLATELVCGDIVKFTAGDRIPADIRLITAFDVEVDESSLTGEAKPCQKHTQSIDTASQDLPLADRTNIGFMGTLVRRGHGSGVVVGTGRNTEFGTVFSMMRDVEAKRTPLQNKMDDLGKQLSVVSFAIIALISLLGILQGRDWLDMFTIAVSLAVAAIPEGLPIVVTVTLALGVLRMAKRHAIIKKLPSVESLGSVNVLCVDKTGTLTMNRMTVTKVFLCTQWSVYDYERQSNLSIGGLRIAKLIGNLCNNAHFDDNGLVVGQPTEVALMEMLKGSNNDERKNFKRVAEFPFNSDRKWMAVLCRPLTDSSSLPHVPPLGPVASRLTGGRGSPPSSDAVYYMKGSLEGVLDHCSSYLASETDVRPMDSAVQERIVNASTEIASQGLRVLALAYGRDLTAQELTFVGFVGMHDPPRPGVEEAMSNLLRGGVRVVMITGDSDITAVSIARQLGIPLNPSGKGAMSGTEVDSMSDKQLADAINNVAVFYRATPRHKMAIVRAYQSKGLVVAMTGDGVNDAPALRLADIGISMGKSGTDVSREASDMILVNDDFGTILYAIEEGKSIFFNIQNFLRFQLSTSISALTLIACATLFGLKNPLNAMQILYINIICDGPVAQSLGVEEVDPDVMRRPPMSKTQPIVDRALVTRVLTSAGVIVVGTMWVYWSEMEAGTTGAHGTTKTFTCFVLFDMFNSLACRSSKRSAFSIGFQSNRMYTFAVAATLLSQLVVIYVPFFQSIFQTVALSTWDLFGLTILSSSVLWVDEIRKLPRSAFGGGGGSILGNPGAPNPSWVERVSNTARRIWWRAAGSANSWQRVPTEMDSV